jgi:hypothetical protein
MNHLNGSISRAFVVKATDGQKYAVKGMQTRADRFDIRRPLCNDQIVGRLGKKMGAPVPEITFVDLSAQFISLNPMISYMLAGVCHGQLLMDGCGEKAQIAHVDVSLNRPRFAAISLLYGWIPAGDRQLIYEKLPPYLVYSVDHGHFFPGGPNWTVATLKGAPPPTPYNEIVVGCKLKPADIADALKGLAGLTLGDIAAALAMPLDVWAMSIDERAEAADYLEKRRLQMLSSIKGS